MLSLEVLNKSLHFILNKAIFLWNNTLYKYIVCNKGVFV